MPIAEESVFAVLSQIQDPELLVNIVDLGLIYEVRVTPQDSRASVYVKMTMTTPSCPWGPELIANVKDAVRGIEGVGSVDVELALSPPWTPDRMTDDARDELGLF